MFDMNLEEIECLLDDSAIGRLCMAGSDGKPYCLPFPFCFDDGALYLRVSLSGRKGEILRDNPQVCFEVDVFSSNLDDYASVLIEGTFCCIDDLEEKARVKQLNDAKYLRLRGGYRPGHGRATPLEDLPLPKILVSSISGKKKHAERQLEIAAR